MKTLLFCTSYAQNKNIWEKKYFRWLSHHQNIGISYSKIMIIDDHSPVIPDWKNLTITTETIPSFEPESDTILHTFNTRFGRQDTWNFPGWYRSFFFAAEYAKKFDYKKVIHIESDAYIISKKIVDYINNAENQWTATWTEKYNTAETAIQIISGNKYINKYYGIANHPYSMYANHPVDTTNAEDSYLEYKISKDFIGDRWGETEQDIPQYADYACQININRYINLNKAWFYRGS